MKKKPFREMERARNSKNMMNGIDGKRKAYEEEG